MLSLLLKARPCSHPLSLLFCSQASLSFSSLPFHASRLFIILALSLKFKKILNVSEQGMILTSESSPQPPCCPSLDFFQLWRLSLSCFFASEG